MIARYRLLAFSTLTVLLFGGCSAPTATLDLLAAAQRGIRSAQEGEAAQHAEVLKHLKTQVAALDSAFDADVRLVAAGQITGSDGQSVELSPDWVISARKGYVAARDLLNGEIRSAEGAHAARQDNLKAAEEALDMAAQLTIQQWHIAQRIKQHLITMQRRTTDER